MTIRVEHLAENVTLYCGDAREVVERLSEPSNAALAPAIPQAAE